MCKICPVLRYVLFLSVLGILAVTTSATQGATTTLDPVGRGWIRDNGFHNDRDVGNNYFAGFSPSQGEYRNWFAFDLSSITGTVTVAEMIIEINEYVSPDATETWELHHVSTAPGNLGTVVSVAHYDDLGDGPVLGSHTFSSADEGNVTSFHLGRRMIDELNAAIGGPIEFGGLLTSLSGQTSANEGIFVHTSPDTTTQLRITTVSEPIPGDGNGDGWVDGIDYLLWAGVYGSHPGANGDPSDGDYNDDGWVDGLDYLLWAGSFGMHAGTAVPEPGALALLVAGIVTALFRRAR